MTNHLNLSDPVSNGYESLSICHIINQQNTLSSSKIRCCNCSKSFLSGRIPNLFICYSMNTMSYESEYVPEALFVYHQVEYFLF